jgi:hypothetical protein
MSATAMLQPQPPQPDLAAVKTRQQGAWSSGDYAVVGTTLQIAGESLCEALDLRAGSKVLDVAAGNGKARCRQPVGVRRRAPSRPATKTGRAAEGESAARLSRRLCPVSSGFSLSGAAWWGLTIRHRCPALRRLSG